MAIDVLLCTVLVAALGVVSTLPGTATTDSLQVSMAIARSCTILVPDLSQGVLRTLDTIDAAALVKVRCNDILPLSIVFVPGPEAAETYLGPDRMAGRHSEQAWGDVTEIVSVITY